MFKERRKVTRRRINRFAQFRGDGATASGSCMVTDISDGGARLFSETELPEAFTLWVSVDNDVNQQHECRVVWRLGGEVGVEFVERAGR